MMSAEDMDITCNMELGTVMLKDSARDYLQEGWQFSYKDSVMCSWLPWTGNV